MGFEDRQYTREDSVYGGGGYGGGYGGGTGLKQFSIVTILIAINVFVWVADMFVPQINSWLSLDTAQPWRIWTILTYGFAHSPITQGVMHILFNMFVLFMFGRPVSQRLGRNEFLRFYLTAIVFAGLVFFLWNLATGERAAAIGASGATMAVLILFILWYPHQKLYLFGIIEMPAWILGVAVVGFDLLRAFSPESNVAWQAHLGGAAFAWMYLHFQWNFSWMNFEDWMPKGKGNLSIYDPDSRPSRSDKLREEGDRILAKISEQGEDSLSSRERKTLEKYSKMLRDEK